MNFGCLEVKEFLFQYQQCKQGSNLFSGTYALLIMTDEDGDGSGESMSSCDCKSLYFVGGL